MCQLAWRPLAFSLGSLALLATASCAASKRVYPVSGKVLYEGKPAAQAIVKFYTSDKPGKHPVPQAIVADDGSFRLTTFRAGDGAPAGNYRVSVSWTRAAKSGDEAEKPLIPSRYFDPETSGLSAVVDAGGATLQPFQLTKK